MRGLQETEPEWSHQSISCLRAFDAAQISQREQVQWEEKRTKDENLGNFQYFRGSKGRGSFKWDWKGAAREEGNKTKGTSSIMFQTLVRCYVIYFFFVTLQAGIDLLSILQKTILRLKWNKLAKDIYPENNRKSLKELKQILDYQVSTLQLLTKGMNLVCACTCVHIFVYA